jgi:hypothetical protein
LLFFHFLAKEEWGNLTFQFGISKTQHGGNGIEFSLCVLGKLVGKGRTQRRGLGDNKS